MVVGRISLLQHPITNELSAVDAIQLSHRCHAYPRVVVANKRCRMRTDPFFLSVKRRKLDDDDREFSGPVPRSGHGHNWL